MNPKIVKINEEHAKNDAKIAKLQARNRELEKQRLEIENTDIVGLVRSVGLTTEQLASIIHGMSAGQTGEQSEEQVLGQENHAYDEN